MKPLLIALLAGPMLGCATPLLHEVVLRDVVPQSSASAGSQMSGESQAEPADDRMAGANTAVPVPLAGTMFDETQPAKVTLAMYEDAAASDGTTVPAYPSVIPPIGGAALSNSEIHLLPPISDPGASGDLSAAGAGGAANDQHDPVANINVNTPSADVVEPPAFSQLQDYPLLYTLLNDERNFYRCSSLEWLAVGLGGSAILANTHVDQGFRDAYGESLRPANTELDFFKQFGNGVYVIPSLAAIWAVDHGIDLLMDEDPFASTLWLEQWSGRSMRGLIVGAVPLLTLQEAIGSSRPSEGGSSRWEPFKSSHGVSGHAYVCAVPFWTAAQMTDCGALEVGFYATGTIAGWSRIHTDSHYLSQVVMGWWLAGLSVSAVDHTELQIHQWYVTPTVDDGGAGIAMIHLR